MPFDLKVSATMMDHESDHSETHIDYSSSPISFPQKLFILLEEDTSDVIEWAANGLCFRIKHPDRFAKFIMPKYFKQSKLTSFQRQLNLYGFRRISRGEDLGCYFHPSFHRNRQDLLKEIKRLPAKGSLITYEQVLAMQEHLPAAPSSSAMNQSVYMSNVVNYGMRSFVPEYYVSAPVAVMMGYPTQSPQSLESMNMLPVDSCSSSHSNDDSSVSSSSSWTHDGSDDPAHLEFQEDFNDIDFFEIFSCSKFDFSIDPLLRIEPREYIPTYEEAVMYGMIQN